MYQGPIIRPNLNIFLLKAPRRILSWFSYVSYGHHDMGNVVQRVSYIFIVVFAVFYVFSM